MQDNGKRRTIFGIEMDRDHLYRMVRISISLGLARLDQDMVDPLKILKRRDKHRWIAEIIGILVVCFGFWVAYHTFLENTSSVWVNEEPPKLLHKYLPANTITEIHTRWVGHYRVACTTVTWKYEVTDAEETTSLWRDSSPASILKAVRPPKQPLIYLLPFPPLPPGTYKYKIFEHAECNPWRKWVNKQAEFEVYVLMDKSIPHFDQPLQGYKP